MPIGDFRVGPPAASACDGTPLASRLGRLAEQICADGQGHFYELAYRGQLYTGIVAGITLVSTNATPLAANTGVPILGIFNPVASPVNLEIVHARMATTSGTPAGPFLWNVIPPNAGITAAGTKGINSKTLTTGGYAILFANAAITGTTVAGTLYRMFGGPTTAASPSGDQTVDDFVDGSIIVPPGGFAGIACTGAGTTHIVGGHLIWAEVAV